MIKEQQRIILSELWGRADRALRVYTKDDRLVVYPEAPRWHNIGPFLNKECIITRIRPEFIEARLTEDVDVPRGTQRQDQFLGPFEGGVLVGMFFALAILVCCIIVFLDFAGK